MFHVILYQPEIPPNTGNIIRLCANTDCKLHLIEPLGFELTEKPLRRAGLDYHDLVRVTRYESLKHCIEQNSFARIFALSSKASTPYTQHQFQAQDAFLFGPETRGLPEDIKQQFPQGSLLKIPQHTTTRSLNLSNSVAIVIYEAWRQCGFALANNG